MGKERERADKLETQILALNALGLTLTVRVNSWSQADRALGDREQYHGTIWPVPIWSLVFLQQMQLCTGNFSEKPLRVQGIPQNTCLNLLPVPAIISFSLKEKGEDKIYVP